MNPRNYNSVILSLLGHRPVVFNTSIARLGGGVTEGLFLCQLLYWTQEDGQWVYRTIKQFQDDVLLNRYEQDKAIKSWTTMGVLEVEVRGLPARRYFRVNLSKLVDLLGEKGCQNGNTQFVEGEQTGLPTLSKLTYKDHNKEHKSAAEAASPLPRGEKFDAPPLKVESFFDKPRAGKDDSALPMSLPEFVLMCRGSASRAVRLVGEYADERRLAFETRGQWREIGRRNLGVAKRLSPFNDRQISDAIRRVKKDFKTEGGFISKWGLETLEKYLEETGSNI